MPRPFLRSRSPLTPSFTNTLSIPIGLALPGDLAVVFAENIDWFELGSPGRPALPAGFRELFVEEQATSHYKIIYYAKVPDGGLPATINLITDSDVVIGSQYGFAEVFGDVSWRTPGWIEIPGTAGNYATFTRSDIGSAASLQFCARVQFDTLGVTQWFQGWANADAGLGLNSSNRPIMFVNNTLGNPIGNTASSADVPGLDVGKRIWLMGQVTASSGECQYWYSYDDVEDPIAVHWEDLSTVAGSNAGTTIRVTNSDTVFIGTRDAATTPFDGRVYAIMQLRPGVVYDIIEHFSEPVASPIALVGTASQVRPTDDDGNGSPIENWGLGDPFTFLFDFFAPNRNFYGPNRLIYNSWLGGRIPAAGEAGHGENPVSGPEGWDIYPDRATQTYGLYSKVVTRTKGVDGPEWVRSDSGQDSATTDGHYSFGVLSLALRGRTDPVLPPTNPEPARLRLGCAETYTTWILDNTYERTIEQVRWSSIEWERVEDAISTAKAVCPDALGGVECVANLGGLEPWRYGLRIERNDAEVWSGPITNVQRIGKAIQISAADILARYQKRFLTRVSADFIDTDAGEVIRQVLTVYSSLSADAWDLRVPKITVGVPVTRHMKPREFKYTWDFISELFDSCLDGYIMNGRLYLWEPGGGWKYQAEITRTLDGPYNTNYEFVYGTFTEEAWQTRPDWSIDGAGQATYVAIPAADSGEYGFRSVEYAEDLDAQVHYGVLDNVDPDALDLPEDATPKEIAASLLARAESVKALRALPPIVMEGGTLSQDAPIDVDNLRPGSLWKVDIYDAGYGQLLTVGRLRRVKVSVRMTENGLQEQIQPVLYPPGWRGEDL